MHLHPGMSVHKGNRSLQGLGREESEVIKEQDHRIKMVALNGGVWQEEVSESQCVKTDRQTGRPSSGLWEEAAQQQYCSSFLIIHSHLLPHSWLMGNTENCRKPAFPQGLSLPISPLWRGGYLEADLYTGARHHQGSPLSKLLKRQWSRISLPARRGLLKGKGILLRPQDKPSYV